MQVAGGFFTIPFHSLPLGGEQSVEECAAWIAWRLLCENICEDVVALTTGFVLTHQLGLEEGRPTPLQSLHPSHVRLRGQRNMSTNSYESFDSFTYLGFDFAAGGISIFIFVLYTHGN